jgi:hypothetical protein
MLSGVNFARLAGFPVQSLPVPVQVHPVNLVTPMSVYPVLQLSYQSRDPNTPRRECFANRSRYSATKKSGIYCVRNIEEMVVFLS